MVRTANCCLFTNRLDFEFQISKFLQGNLTQFQFIVVFNSHRDWLIISLLPGRRYKVLPEAKTASVCSLVRLPKFGNVLCRRLLISRRAPPAGLCTAAPTAGLCLSLRVVFIYKSHGVIPHYERVYCWGWAGKVMTGAYGARSISVCSNRSRIWVNA